MPPEKTDGSWSRFTSVMRITTINVVRERSDGIIFAPTVENTVSPLRILRRRGQDATKDNTDVILTEDTNIVDYTQSIIYSLHYSTSDQVRCSGLF